MIKKHIARGNKELHHQKSSNENHSCVTVVHLNI